MGTVADPVDRGEKEFDGGSHAIGASRDFTVAFLDRAAANGVGLDELLVERARLIVSELVTNAVKYADGPVSLSLDIRADLLVIAVTDTSRALPEAEGHDPERIGRHGLEIVKMLCRSVEVTPQLHGKRVTALISLH